MNELQTIREQWVVELDRECWKADYVGVTTLFSNAKGYNTISAATYALGKMREWGGREYRNAKIYLKSEYKAALDNLTAEPSEDARELAFKIHTTICEATSPGYHYFGMLPQPGLPEAAALIEADRQKVREECVRIAKSEKYVQENGMWNTAYNSGIDAACAAITGAK